MAEQLDRLIEWVVGVLGKAGTEGLSISVLFDHLTTEFGLDVITKNGVWEVLIAREDALLADETKELALSKSPLKKLALEDVFDLSLSERKICIKSQEKPASPEVNGVIDSIEVDVDGKNIAGGKRKAAEELLLATPKRRRGRPPKKRDEVLQLPSVAGPSTPASSPVAPVEGLQTSTSPGPPVSSTRTLSSRKRTQTIKAVEGPPIKKPRKQKARVESTALSTPQTHATTEPESKNTPATQTPLSVFDSAQPSTRPRLRNSRKSSTPVQPVVAFQSPDIQATESNTTPALRKEEITSEPSEPTPETLTHSVLAVTAPVEQPIIETAPQSSPIAAAVVEQTHLPNAIATVTEKPRQFYLQVNVKDGEGTTKTNGQSSTSLQVSPKTATPLESVPLSEVTPTTVYKPAALHMQEARQNDVNATEPSTYTPEKLDRHLHVGKRTPTKASPIFTVIEASPKFPGERRIQQAVFTSQDDLDRQSGVSRVYVDPVGSQRPGVSLQRYGKTTSCIAVFKSARLKDAERLERHKGSWVIAFAETIAQGVDEAKKAATPIRRKRKLVDEAGEGTPSEKRKTLKSAYPLTDSRIDYNIETAGIRSDESQPVLPSTIVDQLLIQTTSTNTNSPSEIETIPATHASGQDAAAATIRPTSPQQFIPLPTAISTPTNLQQQETPAMPSQRHETRILPPQKTAPKSATEPATASTNTSAKETIVAPIKSSTRILPNPRRSTPNRGAPLRRTAYSPPHESTATGDPSMQILPPVPTINPSSQNLWMSHMAYGQDREEITSKFTSIVPSTATLQTSNMTLAISPENDIRRAQASGAATLGSTAGATLHLPSYATAIAPARAYISPYGSNFETSASQSTLQQSDPHQQNQSRRTPVGSSIDSLQRQDKPQFPQVSSVQSEAAAFAQCFESTAPGQASEKPTASFISVHLPVPPPPSQNLLPEIFVRSTQPYRSPYTSTYSSPYASKPGPRESQEPATVLEPISSAQLIPLPLQITVQGQPDGFFSQEPSNLDPHLFKKLSGPGSPPKGRTVASLPQSSAQVPPKGFFSQEPAHMNPQFSKELFKPKPRRRSRISSSPAPRLASEEARKRRLSRATSQVDENLAQSPPHKRRTNSLQEDPKLLELSKTEAVTIPEGVTRLACFFNKMCGNLLLSKDLSVLEFFSARQLPPETPVLALPISQVAQNPIVSIAGSKPMELRIKAKDDEEDDVTYCFSFAETGKGSEAANNMRAKIVTALIAYKFLTGGKYERPDDVQLEILKPYKCEKCGARFKNPGGLDYHLTKSATACNPNYDLTLLAEKNERAERRKKASRLRKEPKELKARGRPRNKKSQLDQTLTGPKEMTTLETEEADQSDSSTSSEDSIIEFWKKNSTMGVERPRRVGSSPAAPKAATVKSKVYKSLPFEAPVLRQVAEEIANTEKSKIIDRTLAEGTSGPAESSSSSETSDVQRCEEILLSLIRDNHHIFPGGRSIWIAFVQAWLKKHTGSPTLPESKLCSKTVDDLVERKKLKCMDFSFIDAKKRVINRTILAVPGRKVDSTAISVLKDSIQASHPAFYVPSQFAPPESILSTLNALATRTLPDRYRMQESADIESEPSNSRSATEVNDESSDDEFVGDENEEEDPLADLGSDEEEAESASENENTDEADELDEGKARRDTRKRSAAHNKAIAEGVRKSWLKIKAKKSGGYFLNRKPRKDRVPLTQEEKDRRANNAALRQRSWDFAPAFMPNPETGAWDQVPPRSTRKGRRHELRPRFPEPITYMQAPNGAWSVRPFGHGVNPIYSRPARRAEGNPGFENYRRRIENGFRPVIFPTKNRMLGPAKPSKALLRELTEPNQHPKRPHRAKSKKSGQRISTRTGRPVREYRMRGGSQSPDSEEAAGELVRSYGFPRRVPNDENDIPSPFSAGWNSRTMNFLDEVHLLNFFEPKKLEIDAQRNTGLETIPPSFGLDSSRYQGPDPEVHEYEPDYENVEFIEPQMVEEGLEPGDGSWVVSAWTPFKSEDFIVKWDDATTYGVETIPYGELDFEWDEVESSKRRTGKFVPNKQKLKKLTAAEKYSFTRVLTSLPQDFVGVFETPQDAIEEFGIELGKPNEATLDNRRVKGRHTIMEPEGERRFIVTVVVIRTLTGGLDFRIDWVLVSQFFQEYSCNFLLKYWLSLQPAKKKIIDRIVADFQEAFIPAYESGEISRLDYGHLVDYDWKALIDWALEKIDTKIRNKPLSLPGSKHELKQAYDCVELDRDPDHWRESYFGLLMPTYKRIEVAAAEPYIFQPQQEPIKGDFDDLTLARSWVRATVLTPQQHIDLDAELVQERLADLGLSVVDEILKAFLSEKVVIKHSTKRTLLGRKYAATSTFFHPLQRQHIQQKVFVQAVNFKRFLDDHFSVGAECVRSDYMANEGSIMATTTLHAQGRIRLVPVGVPMNKFGLTGGGYETKKIPKEKVRFNMDIYPTDSYVFDSYNDILQAFFECDPPRGPETGEIPLWYGISDRILPEIWKKVLVGVSQIVALRSGITIAALTRIFKPTLGEWEIRILVTWGMELGLFKRLHESIEGWTVGEEWWLLVGRTCINGE